MSDRPEVALVNMPFALLEHPPLGLGLLKGALARRGVGARVYNLNLRFGRTIGALTYARMAMARPTMLVGEWMFSAALWGADEASDAVYMRDVIGLQPDGTVRERVINGADGSPHAPDLVDVLTRVRAAVEPFLDECMRAIPWGEFRVVGFTSTFEQHVASLALAKRIKRAHPGVFVAIGGANCEDAMGEATFRAFPFLDAVSSGEADLTFPDLVTRVLAGEPVSGMPGLMVRDPAPKRALPTISAKASTKAPIVTDMDALPIPDFDDYFEDLTLEDVQPRIMFETSRGCWWGAKQHCTFCGLNGSGMAFREKSADRAIDELKFLLGRYGARTRSVSAADNIIPLQYFKDFLPKLKELKLDLSLFYETKANLKKEQIELYREAGLTAIQPGIESLSTPVLRLMRKGVTRLQNVQLLKWCTQYGVHPFWNYIIGFPGESPDDYAGQDALVRAIAHLPPPDGWGPVRFDRFSPYFTKPDSFGLRDLRPYPAYEFVYRGVEESSRKNMAYFFEAEFDGKDRIKEYTAPLVDALKDWTTRGETYALFSMEVGPRLQVFDLRPGATSFVVTLEGLTRAVYEACDRISSRGRLAERVTPPGAAPPSEAAVDDALARLVEDRLLVREGDDYLAVGVPLGYRWSPAGEVRKAFIAKMRSAES